VTFPSWGGSAAGVTVVLRDGRSQPLGPVRIPLRRVAHLRVQSRDGAYVVLPRTRPAGATVHLLPVRPQSSAPLAGPSLAVQLLRASRASRARFSARFAPVAPERAAETAARLAE
jgi:hypothetical protein